MGPYLWIPPGIKWHGPTRVNIHCKEGLISRGILTGVESEEKRDHEHIGTSQTASDICLRTADRLPNKFPSPFLSLFMYLSFYE